MIRFMRYNLIYLILSALVLIPGTYFLLRFGLKPAIDFTGGTMLELKVSGISPKIATQSGALTEVKTDDLKKTAENQKLEVGSIQKSGETNYIYKIKSLDNDQKNKLISTYKETYQEVSEVRYENVGPILGQEMMQKTIIAAIVATLAILSYVAYAFKNIRFGIAAVIALVHDVLIVIGIYAILGQMRGVEVDSLFVTAILTTMSFSVHDTIVVFDRIREYQKRFSSLSYDELIDTALTETMGRSLNNSLTIVFMLLALFLLGGETVKWFTLALLIGTISGTYSSPFIATPIVYIWHKLRDRRR
jgi:preprotein translocase subunit SecF